MDATSTATTTTRAQYRKRLSGYRVSYWLCNHGNNRGVVVMSDFYVSTYRTPTCNDHLDLEKADDATCPWCAIFALTSNLGRKTKEIERLRSALELIACGGRSNFEQDPAFDYGTNVAMHLQQIAREALKDE
jgi:hypothetical protein